jgi:hypothetical protein
MALPQQVIDRMSRESPGTPGWSFGLLFFTGGVLAILLIIYFGLTLGYEPYVNNQVSNLQVQINALASAISPTDQTNLVTFYSEVTNIQSTLANHVYFSQFLSWLESNTEANVHYSNLNFTSGQNVTLSALAASEADVNQQLAIFETSPSVKSVNIASVSLAPATNLWQFNVTLTMDPTLFLQVTTSTATTQ